MRFAGMPGGHSGIAGGCIAGVRCADVATPAQAAMSRHHHPLSPGAPGDPLRARPGRVPILRRLLACVCLTAVSGPAPADASGPAGLVCSLRVMPAAAGQPVPLAMTLHNRANQALRFLVWDTPFEGWASPFVVLRFGEQELPYQGPVVRRSQPGADAMVSIPAGGSRRAEVDLAQVFDLSRPGRYRLEPRITLRDHVLGETTAWPRSGGVQKPLKLPCPAVEFVVPTPRRPAPGPTL